MARSFAIALACVGTLGCSSGEYSGVPAPGTELYSLSADNVTEVLVSSEDQKLFAYRWKPGDAFELTLASPSGAAEHCRAGRPFEQWLQTVATAKVEREMKPPVSDTTPGWHRVLLRDTTSLQPIDVRLRIPPSGSDPVLISFEGKQYVVQMDIATLRYTRANCKGLGTN